MEIWMLLSLVFSLITLYLLSLLGGIWKKAAYVCTGLSLLALGLGFFYLVFITLFQTSEILMPSRHGNSRISSDEHLIFKLIAGFACTFFGGLLIHFGISIFKRATGKSEVSRR
jgi:hypothetical protein